MSLSSIDLKLDFLHQNISSKLLRKIENNSLNIISKCLGDNFLPNYLKKFFLLDLLYPFLKHRIWIINPLFRKNIQMFLVESFRIEQNLCSTLLENICALMEKFYPISINNEFFKNEKNFLTYIFITTLNSSNQKLLAEEIGMGTNLLKKLKESAQFFSDKNRQENHYFFDREESAIFLQVIQEVSENRLRKPWNINTQILFYRIADIPEPWQQYLEEPGISKFFEFLYYIGSKQPITMKSCILWFEQNLGAAIAYKKRDKYLELLMFLEAKDLLLLTGFTAKKRQTDKTTVYLNELAWKLTAPLFAFDFLKRNKERFSQELMGIHPEWQKETLKTLKDEEKQAAIKFLLNDQPISPEMIDYLFAEEVQWIDPEKLILFLKDKIKSGPSPRIRIAICHAMGRFKNIDLFTNLLKEAANKDRSQLVRRVAKEELYKIQTQEI